MNAETPIDELHRLARALRGLYPSWTNPEAYHLAKSEIANGLQRLAGRLGQPLPMPPPPATPRVIALSGYLCRCAGCGKPFRARRKEQRHCSPACRVRAFKQRRRAQAA